MPAPGKCGGGVRAQGSLHPPPQPLPQPHQRHRLLRLHGTSGEAQPDGPSHPFPSNPLPLSRPRLRLADPRGKRGCPHRRGGPAPGRPGQGTRQRPVCGRQDARCRPFLARSPAPGAAPLRFTPVGLRSNSFSFIRPPHLGTARKHKRHGQKRPQRSGRAPAGTIRYSL